MQLFYPHLVCGASRERRDEIIGYLKPRLVLDAGCRSIESGERMPERKVIGYMKHGRGDRSLSHRAHKIGLYAY